ncbi:MAG: hypothetical protein Athens071426_45 [Parcubacteria group bacterium Athens0714_26]|nr:MAG: hypothetical protein Athens071426_45 [Parcubacteria group bacterium Athens0714_26]
MNIINDKNLERIFEKVLELLDSGKSQEEILNLFPESREMLKEIFFTINLFKKEGESIIPSKELFKQIIERIPSGVTNEVNPRYLYRKEVQSRFSFKKINNITKIYNLMTINWKIWAPVGIVAVVTLVTIGFNQLGIKAPQAPIAGEMTQAPVAVSQELPVAVTKPATGNVDDAVDAILASISDDEAFFADATKDAELIAADSQSISNFGQSYNENEF